MRLKLEDNLNENFKNIMIGSNNTLASRILSYHLLRKKGEVIGFYHGEPIVTNNYKLFYLEFPLCTQFYTYTENIKKEMQILAKNKSSINNNIPEILSANSKKFKLYKNKFSDSKKSNNVMIIGNCYLKDDTFMSSIQSFPRSIQLDFEKTIINKLRKQGMMVFYKKHPGSPSNYPNDFLTDLHYVNGLFEDKILNSYILFFSRITTSTIGAALCTKNPIIICYGDWETPSKSMLHYLESRCSLIKIEYDEDGNLKIPSKIIKNIINESRIKSKNDSFYNKYLRS